MPTITGATLVNSANLLRTEYADIGSKDQLNLNIPYLRMIGMRSKKQDQGSSFKINLRTSLSRGGGWVSEYDDSPEPGNVGHAFTDWTYKRYERVARWSYEQLSVGGQVVDAINDEVMGVKDGWMLDNEMALWGEASGLLATVQSATSTTSFTVDTDQYINDWQRVDILLKSTGTIGSAGVLSTNILTITPDDTDGTAVVTIDTPLASSTIGTTYGIYLHNSYNKGRFGFKDIISSSNPAIGNYGGIDRTTTKIWQALEIDHGGAVINPRAIRALYTKIHLKSGIFPTIGWAHPFLVDDLIARGANDRRTDGTRSVDHELFGRGASIDGVNIFPSRFCPYGEVQLHTPRFLAMYFPPGQNTSQPNPGEWILSGQGKGTRLHKLEGKLVWGSSYTSMSQLVCLRPSAFGRLYNIAWAPKGKVS